MSQHHAGRTVDAVQFIEQVDRSGEFDFAGQVRRLAFTTKRSRYEWDPETGQVRGGAFGPDWVSGRFLGTTFGGSMLAVERLIPGAFGAIAGPDGEMRTGTIQTIEPESMEDYMARKAAALGGPTDV